jgi:hypothetical protein
MAIVKKRPIKELIKELDQNKKSRATGGIERYLVDDD